MRNASLLYFAAILALSGRAAAHGLQAPVLFETNQGQADPGVDYLCSGVNRWYSISARTATLQLGNPLNLRFVNANPDARHEGSHRQIAGNNFLIGDDPKGWLVNVPTYGQVRYMDVWPGIDVLYHGSEEGLEYDFVLAPHSATARIQLAFEGADSLFLNSDGDLVIDVHGTRVTQRRPAIFQTMDGRRVNVTGHYSIGPDQTVGILVDKYDANRELTIDPVILYSVPVLGPALASGNAIATDSAGTAYITGQSVAMGSPAQPQGYVLKLNRSGMPAAQATFFGSTDGPTVGNGIALDSAGNIYIAGTTSTRNYFGLFNDPALAAPAGANAFIIKFDNSGAMRLYSSYIGGAKDESGNAIAVHGTGTAYITGSTASSDFPTTLSTPLIGQSDSFVTVIDTTVSGAASVVASRLLGGVGDVAKAIAVDGPGNIYVGGSLRDATSFPTTPNALSSGTLPPNVGLLGFVTKLDPTNTQLLYSTKFPSGDVTALALDSSARVYVTGNVLFSAILLTTPLSNPSTNQCEACAFVAELDTTQFQLSSLLYMAGFRLDYITQSNGIAVAAPGDAYIVGANVPQLSSGNTTAFLARINTTLNGPASLVYSTTFAAGFSHDFASAVALDPAQNVYVTGTTTPYPPQMNNPPANASRAFAVAFSPPSPVQVSPDAASGASQGFTFTYTDQNGYQDISGSQILINSSPTAANACYILFGRSNNLIALADDSGATFSTTTLGSPAVLQNSQCTVVSSLSSQSASLNSLTLTVFVIFKSGFTGVRNIYSGFTTNAGTRSTFAAVGTFTASGSPPPLSAGSVTPSIGSGQTQGFTFSYLDPIGYPDISGTQMLFNSTQSPVNGCYILFGRGTNLIALGSDDGNSFTPAVLGSQATLQNSQCIVYPGNSFQSGSLTGLSVTLFVAFKPTFAGARNIYSGVTTNGGTRSSFAQLGTWTVPSAAPALSVNSLSPASPASPSQALTFVYVDPNGFADILGAQVIVNPTQSLVNSCYVQFTRETGAISLAGDDGVSVTTAVLGQPVFLQNSQCIVNAAASYQSGSANTLSLTLFITPKTSITNTIYSGVTSNTLPTSGISQIGVWSIPPPASLRPVSVTPPTGAGPAGATQYFTFTYSDPSGANDISGSQIIFNPALQGAGACYVLYGRGTNLLALASDDANTFTTGLLGSAGTLQNTQCSIDLSKSFQAQTGSTVNLTVAVSFKPSYRQLLYVFSNVVNNAGTASPFPSLGTFVVQ